MDRMAEAIALTLRSRDNMEQARAIVKELTDKYPLVG
jgi:glycine hydroxymethyltransferase